VEDAPKSPFPFSFQKKAEIVENFIEAFLGGQVRITKPDVGDSANPAFYQAMVLATDDVPSERWSKLSEGEKMAEYLLALQKKAEILIGLENASEDEIGKAVDFMMTQVWLNRLANRMEGEFLAVTSLKNRVSSLEKEVRSHHSTLEELRILMRAAFGSGSGVQNP
jgi:hypothetical protein